MYGAQADSSLGTLLETVTCQGAGGSCQDIDPHCRLAAAKAVARVTPNYIPEAGTTLWDFG